MKFRSRVKGPAKSRRGNRRTESRPQARAKATPVHPMLELQSTLGNQAVQRMLRAGMIQTKPKISQPGDQYQQEADRVAEHVMRMPGPKVVPGASGAPGQPPTTQPLRPEREEEMQRQPIEEEDKKNEQLQMQAQPGQRPIINPNFQAQITGLQSSGQPLAPSQRAFFEPRFGRDFSQVRVHTDTRAADMTKSINAKAFTVERNIAFGAGEYAPATAAGTKLLAHELTHVVQQSGAYAMRFGQSDEKRGLSPIYSNTPEVQCKEGEEGEKPKRIAWKYHYKTKKEAEAKIEELRKLGINVSDPIEDKKSKEPWTFFVTPMSKAEAKKVADDMAKAKPTHTITVEHEKISGVPYIKDVPKCPEAIDVTSPMQRWPQCFTTAKDANALKARFDAAHIEAEVVKLSDKQFGLRFQPMTEAEARTKGEAEVKRRSAGADAPMFSMETSEKKELHSFTFDISVKKSPAGFRHLGAFRLTAYIVAQEKDFSEKETEFNPSLPKRTFRKGFLTSNTPPFFGVRKEGSGRALNGDLINFSSGKFTVDPCPRDASGGCLKVGESVAVPADVPLGTELFIEGVGTRKAADHGDAVGSHHIDLYFGETIGAVEAHKIEFTGRNVWKKK